MPQTNYVIAYETACRELAGRADPHEVAVRSGCAFRPEKSFFEVPFLGRLYRVGYPDGRVTPGEPVPKAAAAPPAPAGDHLLTVSILLVHYLTKATGVPVAGEWIAFRELPGGDLYNTPFTNRTIRPLVARFAAEPERLVEAVVGLGGRRERFGHASASLDVFPRLPLCLVVWQGDEEVPASGQILFDRTAPGYLDTEDLVVVAAEAFLAARAAVTPGAARPGTLEPT